jgi:hypothetical protein
MARIVLPGDVGHVPFAQPATFQPAGATGAGAPLVQPAIEWQRPQ